MTTIAWDGKTLAGDAQSTGDYIRPIQSRKIHRVGGALIGCAGLSTEGRTFVEWYKDRSKDAPKLDEDFIAIVIEDGEASYWDEKLTPLPMGTPAAIGSGNGYAMGAMMAGSSAERAVEIASKLDIYTNADIETLKVTSHTPSNGR